MPVAAKSSPDFRAIIAEIQGHQDCNFIAAAAINLYSECLRRRADRILYGPKDAQNLLGMIAMLLDVSTERSEYVAPARDAVPTEDDLAGIADPVLVLRRKPPPNTAIKRVIVENSGPGAPPRTTAELTNVPENEL